uniref:zinc metalloproteinase nas-14-like isoform X7 n=1 Tax=Styela clava TaxID=7725 RepID=UPI00193A31C2|nr:zinc metalloproteinase nas-14-like isoform X7 [Styela clava]
MICGRLCFYDPDISIKKSQSSATNDNKSNRMSGFTRMLSIAILFAVFLTTGTLALISASSDIVGNLRCNGTDVNKCVPACVSYQLDQFGCPTCNCVFKLDKFEGDIKLTPKILINILDRLNVARGAKNHTLVDKAFQLQKWNTTKSGKYFLVPYVFDYSLSGAAFRAILRAIEAFNTHTCVRLISRTFEKDFLNFTDAKGCWSYVGRNGGSQEISISSGCEYVGTVMHQIMHALGFWHKQSRQDRDKYIYILRQNIKSGFDGSFQKQTTDNIDNINSIYDYQSLMHFDQFAFSKDQNRWLTIIQANGNFYDKYNKDYFTGGDVDLINKLYNCPAATNSTSSGNGTSGQKTKDLPQSCEDDAKNCAERKTKGECEGPLPKKVLMGIDCKATCGICKKVETCKDDAANCAERKTKGECEGPLPKKVLMGIDCKATCGICKKAETCKDVATNCVERKTKGECEGPLPKKVLMGLDCKATCGICKKENTETTCKDTGSRCAYRKANAECVGPGAKKIVMQKECQATCGFCKKEPSKTTPITKPTTKKTLKPGRRRNRGCVDIGPRCNARANRGDCDGSWKRKQKMENECRRTCGFCNSGSKCRDQPGKFCNKNRCHKISTRKNCPRTCNACTTRNLIQEPNSLKSILGMFYLAFNGFSDQFPSIF